MTTAVDNDVLIKTALYGLVGDIATVPPFTGVTCVLAQARFVVPTWIRRRGSAGVEQALAAFDAFLTHAELIEPSDEEIELASQLEDAAQRARLPMDSGESLLCAAVVTRSLDLLLTGDKRAIASLERLRSSIDWLDGMSGRVGCLEQLIVALSMALGPERVADLICGAAFVDTAIRVALGCTSRKPGSAVDTVGLDSYVAAVRADAPSLLMD
ncbi:MAG: hypothetical protein U0Q22_18880 [Acidimicrobiales bacterium]